MKKIYKICFILAAALICNILLVSPGNVKAWDDDSGDCNNFVEEDCCDWLFLEDCVEHNEAQREAFEDDRSKFTISHDTEDEVIVESHPVEHSHEVVRNVEVVPDVDTVSSSSSSSASASSAASASSGSVSSSSSSATTVSFLPVAGKAGGFALIVLLAVILGIRYWFVRKKRAKMRGFPGLSGY